ncbi:beta-2-microglobulin-like [Solea solea]|uniref:beta-2-microglobulin-like n=1 Tax=Solea solea TaxID=90069 RepID=UPI00272C9C18|nr:beta-2-microglobulin-like [Solea solea]
MRGFIFVVLLALIGASLAKISPPTVQVYSQTREEHGKPNILICHVTNFYPPMISIKLLKDGKPMALLKEQDLAFEENWYYHLTKFANFTPEIGARYTCSVTHNEKTVEHVWESDL